MSESARLGWVIVYVPDVEEALSFYERAFGLRRTFVDASAGFGQLDTGSTALAFATEERASSEFEGASSGRASTASRSTSSSV